MTFTLTPVPWPASHALLPVLRNAEEGEERILARLADPSCTAYAAWPEGDLVGAAVVRRPAPASRSSSSHSLPLTLRDGGITFRVDLGFEDRFFGGGCYGELVGSRTAGVTYRAVALPSSKRRRFGSALG